MMENQQISTFAMKLWYICFKDGANDASIIQNCRWFSDQTGSSADHSALDQTKRPTAALIESISGCRPFHPQSNCNSRPQNTNSANLPRAEAARVTLPAKTSWTLNRGSTLTRQSKTTAPPARDKDRLTRHLQKFPRQKGRIRLQLTRSCFSSSPPSCLAARPRPAWHFQFCPERW